MALTTPGQQAVRTAEVVNTGRRSRRPRVGSALAILITFCVSVVLVPAVSTNASATPAAPAVPAPAPDLDTVRKQVAALDRQAAEATEEYNATREKLASITVAVKAATVRAEQQRRRVGKAQQALGRLAAETYKSGQVDGLLLLLDDDPQAVMAARGLRSSLSDRQARGVSALLAEQDKLRSDQAAMAEQKRKLTEADKRLAAQKKKVQAKLSESKALLSRLDGSQRRALQRISQTMDSDALSQLGVQVPANGKLTCAGVGIQAPNSKAAAAIAFACAQLGKPYRWGGGGPGSYDCSGLTRAAWAAAGVSLPHNAAMQASSGTRVSADSLQPGDLVFFYSPISHTGIYIGKGLMVHAPSSGDVVKIASARLDGRLTAATRL